MHSLSDDRPNWIAQFATSRPQLCSVTWKPSWLPGSLLGMTMFPPDMLELTNCWHCSAVVQ